MTDVERPLWTLIAPRFWPTWIALGLVRCFEPLPFRVQLAVGRAFGRFARLFMAPQRRVVRRNLELCMPELTREARRALERRHFESLGIALFETANGWWKSNEQILARARVEGLEHLQRALERGKGALLLGAHFTTTEIGVRVLAATVPLNVMYRPSKDALISEFLRRNRGRRVRRAILRDDIRTLVGALKANECVWYAPDQSFRRKGAQKVRLFGIPAPTNTATSRIARMTGAAVLPYFVERLPGAEGYRAVIHPALADFPGASPVEDGERINRFVEGHARRVPDQYLWIHKRFKSLDAGDPDYYA